MTTQFFPYAGSSAKYARMIAEMARREGYETYAEPMVGSGAVFFQLAPQVAFICDLEFLHTNLYYETKNRPDEVIAELDRIPPVKDWLLEMQEGIVNMSIDLEGPRVAAAWYALLILCYNGVVKKKDGRPLLTWGDRYLTWPQRLPGYKQKLLVVSNMLQGTNILTGDYRICPQADIAFFDPPWFDSEANYGVDFHHPDLAEYLRHYHGKWILSINDTEQARELYLAISKWHMEMTPYYSVAPVGKGRFKRCELLITNFKPQMFAE